MRKPRQRSAAQITACGHKGATLQHPGWAIPTPDFCIFQGTSSLA
jgi:hypothetical protein